MHGKSHLFSQLSVIAPGIVVLMGSTACIAVLDKKVQITKEHGKIVKRDGTIYLITFHPASAMRFPDMKKAFSRDFEKLRKLIKNKP
jgi:DNA polymerase